MEVAASAATSAGATGAAASGAARRRRAQRLRQTAKHVGWLWDLVQGSRCHHTAEPQRAHSAASAGLGAAPPVCHGCSALRSEATAQAELVASLSAQVASLQERLESFPAVVARLEDVQLQVTELAKIATGDAGEAYSAYGIKQENDDKVCTADIAAETLSAKVETEDAATIGSLVGGSAFIQASAQPLASKEADEQYVDHDHTEQDVHACAPVRQEVAGGCMASGSTPSPPSAPSMQCQGPVAHGSTDLGYREVHEEIAAILAGGPPDGNSKQRLHVLLQLEEQFGNVDIP